MVTPSQLNRRAALFEQLATMISAGVPLPKAMDMIGRSRSTGISQSVLRDLSYYLNEGHTFSDAMLLVSGQKHLESGPVRAHAKSAYALSDFDIALLTAGEDSGKLDSSCRLLSRYYASRAQLIRDTIVGMLITVATVHVAMLVFPTSLLTQAAKGVFDGDYSQCIPFIVEKLVVFGLLYGAVWFMAFSSQQNRGESWRSVVQSLTSVIPMLGTALKYLAVARLAMALDALLNAGVSVVRAWELAANASGSIALKRDILQRLPDLSNGTTPAEMVAHIRYFPEMFTNLYQSGELSGRVNESLSHLQGYFEDEGFRKMQTFCRLMMVAVYLAVAILIAIFIIQFWRNYFAQLLNSV